EIGVAYLSNTTTIHYFTAKEDGSSKSTGSDIQSGYSTTAALLEPEVAFYRSGSANHYFVAYVMSDATDAVSDLELWYSANPGYNYAWYDFATFDGASSLFPPRASVTASNIWVSALREVADPSSFAQQVMTRTLDFGGNAVPPDASVEIPVTSGACSGDPPCRPGDKAAFTNFAPFGRVYYSASGSTPSGAFASTLTCN